MARPRVTRSAFTLLELLISTAILGLLVVLLSGVLTGVSNTWKLGQASNDRLENIRSITDIITAELRSALLPVNRTDKGNLQFIKNPNNISNALLNPDALFWQAPVAADPSLGDVAEIGYFVRWDSSNPDRERPILCRFAVSGKSSAGAADPNFLIYNHPANTTNWLSTTIIDSVAPGNVANGYRGLISENVVAFFAECLDDRGRPITKTHAGGAFGTTTDGFDSRLGFTDGDNVKSPEFTEGGTKKPLCVLPPMVRIGFVLIDEKSAQRLRAAEKGQLQLVAGQASDAEDFVTRALANNDLRSINSGLRSFQAEINLLNAR